MNLKYSAFTVRFVLIALLCPLGACSWKMSSSVRIQLSGEPASLDPALAEDGIAMRILSNTMTGLMRWNASGKLVPGLAERYVISNNGLKIQFFLRQKLYWSDGVSVLPDHILAGLKRSLGPGSASKLAPLFYCIKGVKDYHEGKPVSLTGPKEDFLPTGPNPVGFYKDGPTVIFELNEPVTYFPELMALSLALPVREDQLSLFGGKWLATFPTTGFYAIDDHSFEKEYYLKPNRFSEWLYDNPSDFRKTLPITLKIVQDETTAAHLFETGGLDILTRIAPVDLPRLTQAGFIESAPMQATYYLAFNTKKEPFTQKEKRKLAASVIQKTKLIQAIQSPERIAHGYLPPELTGVSYSPALVPENQLTKVATQQPKIEITLGSDSGAKNKIILEKIQSDFKSDSPFVASIELLDWKSYLKQLTTNPPDVFRFAWLSPILDPIVLLQNFTSNNPNNYGHFSSEAYDLLIKQIVALPAGSERSKLIERAQQILIVEEQALVPLYHYTQVYAVSKRLKGFQVNSFSTIAYERLKLE